MKIVSITPLSTGCPHCHSLQGIYNPKTKKVKCQICGKEVKKWKNKKDF